jgi:protoporphyrinogen oxidase
MKNCIVVGGGLCGLFSAIVLAEKFEKVTLIEASDTCGGLLKSVTDDAGVIYDQGTHIPNTTMIPEIDNILFGPENEREQHWNNLGQLKTGNYFAGKWDLSTQVVDTRNLPEDVYQRGVLELLNLSTPSEAEDIVSYLCQTIGPTFTNEIAAPLCKKLYGDRVDLSQLMTNSSVSYFGLSRVLALNPEVTNKLKELPAFDSKLAYHNQEDFQERLDRDNTEECIYYYPKKGQGVQFWIDHLIAQAKAKGVTFLTSESISKISYNNNKITAVTLKNSPQELPCDFLYWSAPPAIALIAADINPYRDESGEKPVFKTANIFHFSFDKPINNTESYYIWNWDIKAKSFRVTLLPNLRLDDKDKSLYNLTIEALSDVDDSESVTVEMMLSELKGMKLISEDAKVLSSLRQTVHNTFPVPTFAFGKSVSENYHKLNDRFENIMISGRFSGKQWFHGDVIKAAYHSIHEKFS